MQFFFLKHFFLYFSRNDCIATGLISLINPSWNKVTYLLACLPTYILTYSLTTCFRYQRLSIHVVSLRIWISHFRVSFYLCIKTWLCAKPFMRKCVWPTDFAWELVLKWRQKETRKWPIKNFCIAYGVQSRKLMLISIKVFFKIAFKDIEKCRPIYTLLMV